MNGREWVQYGNGNREICAVPLSCRLVEEMIVQCDGENPFPQQLWTHYRRSNHAYALPWMPPLTLHRAPLLRRASFLFDSSLHCVLSLILVCVCVCVFISCPELLLLKICFFPIIVSNTCSWAWVDGVQWATTNKNIQQPKVSLKHRKHLMIMQNDYIFSGKSRR